MKHIKKYNESNKIGLNSFDDDELRDRLEYLKIERDDIQNEMSTIYNILKDRKENSEEEYAKSLPESIFDFNKEQLDWLFQHGHHNTSKHYKIAHDYFRKDFNGVYSGGFNPKTEQFIFKITTSDFMNDDENKLELDELGIKTIKFLGNSLKRFDGYVEFDILYHNHDNYYDKIRFIDDNQIQLFKYNRLDKTFNSTESMIEYIVEYDLIYSDGDYE